MKQCKECAANLPDEARFCYNCGAPLKEETPEPPPGPPPPPPELDFVRPALSGGAFLGILSSLPIIGLANFLCCMWVVGGGGIATLLLARQYPTRKLTYGDGAFAGVCSGLFGAMIATLMIIPVKIASAPYTASQQDAIEKLFGKMPEIQGPMLDLMKRLASPEVSAVTLLATFIGNLIIFALFAMIGGILAVVLLNKRNDPASPREAGRF